MCDHVPNVPVRFDVPMPAQDYSYVPVLYARAGQRVKMRVLSRAVTGCMTHWIAGRTRPCYTPIAPCPGCGAGRPRAWKGFLGGICAYTRVRVITMLTSHACRPHVRRLRGEEGGVRGCLLTMFHEGASAAGRTRIELAQQLPEQELAEEFDVEAQLKHMWAVEAAKIGPDDDKERWELIPIPDC